MVFVQEMLAFTGFRGRLHLEWISSAEAQKFARVMSDFTEKIRALGPNPMTVATWQQPSLANTDVGHAS